MTAILGAGLAMGDSCSTSDLSRAVHDHRMPVSRVCVVSGSARWRTSPADPYVVTEHIVELDQRNRID